MKTLKARQFFEDVRKLHSPDASAEKSDNRAGRVRVRIKIALPKRKANSVSSPDSK
jgi:hypothetical protein